MNFRPARFAYPVTAALLLLFGSVTHSDDTEVYIGTETADSAAQRPNILFIIDTSGSMGGNVTTQTEFDPAHSYAGKCPANRIYWTKSGLTGPPVDKNCTLRGTGDSSGWIPVTAFKCKLAQDFIDIHGFLPVTKTAQWLPAKKASNNKWTTLRRADNANVVECGDDSDPAKLDPAHGDGTKPYAANGSNGPFTSDKAQGINWATSTDTNGRYTYYSSNYLNWYYNARTVTKTRLEVVKEVARNTLQNMNDVNVGLMRFSTDGDGGMVLREIGDIAATRETLLADIHNLAPNGNTPLSETLYEAYLYWSGKTWEWGRESLPSSSIASSLVDGSTYKSPIGASCQRNYIVYLTDGEPVSDTGSNAKILELLKTAAKPVTACTPNGTGGESNTNGMCLDDLAEYMYGNDILKSGFPGMQNVTTYTVGFGAEVQGIAWATQLLRDTANNSGGEFYEATDTASLTSVFSTIIQEIISTNASFTAPTVSVNAFNRAQNLNDLYVTVFGTSSKYHWPGNVKKYEILKDGTIVGQDGKGAVDSNTGFFDKNAHSFWSATVDGSEVAAGGAARKLPEPSTRKLYTDLAGSNLTASGNAIASENELIKDEMLGGLDPKITRDRLIQWIRGGDVNGDDETQPRLVMGDPLHARPVTVIYGGTAADPDMLLFATTNDGYLHAIDTKTGIEQWAYIPSHLLRRMTDLYLDQEQSAKRYALDGNLRALKIDENGNGIVDGSDRVYLYFGMGRGGQSYFGLDVTDKNDPKLLWRRGSATEIKADGTYIDANDQLPGLAHAWSTPVPTKVKIGEDVKNVLIFGGGYDASQDNVNDNTDDTGNRIFMIDALTGKLLWRAGPESDGMAELPLSKMDHSIPADVRVLDIDSNGLADRMYVGDMGGRVWRFDIFNGNPPDTLVMGGVFASLGRGDGAGSNPGDARRFYNAPDVSVVVNENQTFLNIAIGSGYRGHPLSREIKDRFYGLRDYKPFTAMTKADWDSFTTITESNSKLIDVTNDIKPVLPLGTLGWRINLDASKGEKVLAESQTFDSIVIFPSYLPTAGTRDSAANTCVAPQGANRMYAISVLDGSPVLNRDGEVDENGKLPPPDETDDRWTDLKQSGIAPEGVILFPETSDPTCKVGVEDCGVPFSNNPVKTFWKRQDTDGT